MQIQCFSRHTPVASARDGRVPRQPHAPAPRPLSTARTCGPSSSSSSSSPSSSCLLTASALATSAPLSLDASHPQPPLPLPHLSEPPQLPQHPLHQQRGSQIAAAVHAAVDLESRAIGALVGAMCGSALGSPLDPERGYRIARLFPDGPLDFWRYDVGVHGGAAAPPPGTIGGETAAMLWSARALVGAGRADMRALLAEMVAGYASPPAPAAPGPDGGSDGDGGDDAPSTPPQQLPQQPRARARRGAARSYGPYSRLVLDALAAGADPFDLPRLATALLDRTTARLSSSAGSRAERQAFGPSDHGALLRVAPLGIVYASAPPATLAAAVDTFALFSHPDPLGRDGALVAAAAIAWLASAEPDGAAPVALLADLQRGARSADMRAKLEVLLRGLDALAAAAPPGCGSTLGPVSDWRSFRQGRQWQQVVATANLLTRHGYATDGTQAAALSLWALCACWRQPELAVVVAASLGGNTSITAALTGALAGALHGRAWIPSRWWDELENGPQDGRDAAVALAQQLARMDCRGVASILPQGPGGAVGGRHSSELN